MGLGCRGLGVSGLGRFANSFRPAKLKLVWVYRGRCEHILLHVITPMPSP